ncbi:MAG: hypothetical protein HYX41_01160 [Bdellovibrio sp.]|nr:hypothetical protein [Bdellovibrio sp.]
MSKLFTTAIFSLALLGASPVFADGHGKCSCDKKCTSECKEGKGENCKCKHCGCSKGKKCSKCTNHHKEKAEGVVDSNP